jgi:hypothetical protein
VTFFESAKHASHGKNLLRAVKASDIASLEGLLFPLAPFAASEASLADPSVVEESDSALRSVPRRQGVVGLVNFVDENGLSPLHHALRTKPAPDLRIIKLLFAAGSDLNLACVSRSTPLHHLAYLGGSDQEVTRKNFQIRREREQAQTAGSEHQRTATAGASSSIQGTAALTGVPSPGKDLAIPSEASSGTVSDLPEVKIDDKEIFTLAGSEIEDELKAAITLLLHLGASPDIADCAGALPLHFAAEVRLNCVPLIGITGQSLMHPTMLSASLAPRERSSARCWTATSRRRSARYVRGLSCPKKHPSGSRPASVRMGSVRTPARLGRLSVG